MPHTWSTFQLRCPLMSAECLAAVLVLSTRLILLPKEIHCQASHRAATNETITLSGESRVSKQGSTSNATYNRSFWRHLSRQLTALVMMTKLS